MVDYLLFAPFEGGSEGGYRLVRGFPAASIPYEGS